MTHFDDLMSKFEERLLKEEVQAMRFQGVPERKIGNFIENYATLIYQIPSLSQRWEEKEKIVNDIKNSYRNRIYRSIK